MRQSFFCIRQSMMIEAEISYSAGSNVLNKTVGKMEMRIKREETRRSITVLFVTLNKKTHTVSALDCTVH